MRLGLYLRQLWGFRLPLKFVESSRVPEHEQGVVFLYPEVRVEDVLDELFIPNDAYHVG